MLVLNAVILHYGTIQVVRAAEGRRSARSGSWFILGYQSR